MSCLMVSWCCREDEGLRAQGGEVQQAVQSAINKAYASDAAPGVRASSAACDVPCVLLCAACAACDARSVCFTAMSRGST